MYLYHTTIEIQSCVFAENSATVGGGLCSDNSNVFLSGSAYVKNSASHAAAIYLFDSTAQVIGCQFEENDAAPYGGGIMLYSSDAELSHCRFTGNHADSSGAAIHAGYSSIRLAFMEFLGNIAGSGGALDIFYSEVDMEYCTLVQNAAVGGTTFSGMGAAVYLDGSQAHINHCILIDNIAEDDGGAIYIKGSSQLNMVRSVLAFNPTGNLVAVQASFDPIGILFNDLYNPEGTLNHNLNALDPSNLTVEPGFLVYGDDGLPADLHLALGSLLVNSGAPDGTDLDGSREDIGIYGNAGGALWDRDQDGFPDWFWPGTIEDAPEGFSPADYDADDHDRDVY